MTQDPEITVELSSQQANRDTLAAWFRLHPLEDISPEALKRMVGDNYQQRISDCRTALGMRVQNMPRYRYDGAGKAIKRLAGWYRYEPYERLGRDPGSVVAAGWSGKHGRPFEQPFELKP